MWQSGFRASHELSAGPSVTGRVYPFSHTKQQKDEHQGWTIQTLQRNGIGPSTEVRSSTRITGERDNWRRSEANAQCVRLTCQNTEEDLCAHLDARRTSASSKKNDMPTFSPMHDEINELRKRLDKLVAKSSEATPSTTSSPFSLEI